MRGKLTLLIVTLAVAWASAAQAQEKKPKIVVFWGDDIGQSNISAYSHGVMGYRTPNIDRIAREGMMFTDYYAERSCTAGRASFITGQSGLRTGLTKVGVPGATLGLRKEDPTIGVPPQCRGRAGERRLSEGARLPGEVRSARRAGLQGL